MRRGVSLLLLMCLLLSTLPTAALAAQDPTSKGATKAPDNNWERILPSDTKFYFEVGSDGVYGEAGGTASFNVSAGDIYQLVNNVYFVYEGADYFLAFINGKKCSIPVDDVIFGFVDSDYMNAIINDYWDDVANGLGTYNFRFDTDTPRGNIYVQGLQKALKTLGYYTGELDGGYGTGTKDAVKAFQVEWALYNETGIADQSTQRAIFNALLNPTPSFTELIAAGFVQVKSAQAVKPALPKLYFNDGTAYRQLVSNQFYVDQGFPYFIYYDANGSQRPIDAINGGGISKLYSKVLQSAAVESYIKGTLWSSTTIGPLTKGLEHNIEVQAVQLALSVLGHYSGELDGTYGDGTTQAMAKFKASASISPAEGAYVHNATLQTLFAAAISAGNGSSTATGGASSITPSNPKVYVTLSKDTNIFTTETSTVGVTVGKGSVLQLVANQYYSVGGEKYYCLYYENKVYRVKGTDINGCIMTDAQLGTFITNVPWSATSFSSLKEDMGLKGNVRVHALQEALRVMGYYSGNVDGNFGPETTSAVKAFQRAYKLEVDGRAGPITQATLYPLAKAKGYGSGSSGAIGGNTLSPTGTLYTNVSVNFRKSTSTRSTRLGQIPKGTTLSYIDTTTSGGVTWYKVVYNGDTGWLMGSYVTVGGSGSGTTGSTTQTGNVTVIKNSTRVRKTANGSKTGVVLGIGTVVPMMGSAVTAGGYTWYYIQTGSGVYGYVRGDCVTVTYSSGTGGTGGTSGILPSSTKSYVKLTAPLDIFTNDEKPASGLTNIGVGNILQLVNTTTVTRNNVAYGSLYYGNKAYNFVNRELKTTDIMSEADVLTYITGTLWKQNYSFSLKETLGLVGDIRAHSAQLALAVLGFYTGSLDGNFGAGTSSAVRNFQRANRLDVDGSIGPATWAKLFPMASAAYSAGSWTSGSTGTTGTPINSGDFGTVRSVEKARWTFGDAGATLIPKYGSAKVMDVETKRVFTAFRWSGAYHADCVPYTRADTKTMCDIVGFAYSDSAPNLNDVKNGAPWPAFTSSTVGSKWDRRAAWLNVNGRVFCVSIYGWPHGFNDVSTTNFPNGVRYHEQNNYYGMFCVHFVGSTTHENKTSNAQNEHQASIDKAYSEASAMWPGLVKSGVQ